MKKIFARTRRAKKMRGISKRLEATRLVVHKTNQHMYAQLIDPKGKVLVSASTLTKELKAKIVGKKKIEQAALVGKEIGEKACAAGVKTVAFDRSGFSYHGRIKAIADAAREAGLEF